MTATAHGVRILTRNIILDFTLVAGPIEILPKVPSEMRYSAVTALITSKSLCYKFARLAGCDSCGGLLRTRRRIYIPATPVPRN